MKRLAARGSVLILSGVILTAGVPARADASALKAVAEIVGCTDSSISGMVTLQEKPSKEGVKEVEVNVVVSGLSEGKHAVHIHEFGDCSSCSAAGGHFDPGPDGNSNPDGNHPFHSGDLVNLKVHGASGVGTMHTTTSRVTLSAGPLSVFDADGSAIIIHVNPDSYCPAGLVAGCAGGGRVACGIIDSD